MANLIIGVVRHLTRLISAGLRESAGASALQESNASDHVFAAFDSLVSLKEKLQHLAATCVPVVRNILQKIYEHTFPFWYRRFLWTDSARHVPGPSTESMQIMIAEAHVAATSSGVVVECSNHLQACWLVPKDCIRSAQEGRLRGNAAKPG